MIFNIAVQIFANHFRLSITGNYDGIDYKVSSIIKDYSTILYACCVAVKELGLLFRIGKLKSRRYKSEQEWTIRIY